MLSLCFDYRILHYSLLMIGELNTVARRLKYHGMGQGGSVQGLRTERAFSGDTNAIQLANFVVGFSQGLFGAHFDC